MTILSRVNRWFILGSFLFFFAGCASFTTFQTPEVLEEGELSMGVGGAGLILMEESGPVVGIGSTDLFARYGLGANTDVGLKISGIIPFIVLAGDIKHQLWKKPIALSLDLGASYFVLDDYQTFGLYPMILAGVKPFFAGVRLTHLIISDASNTMGFPFYSSSDATTATIPSVVLGLYIGNRFQVIPEINYYLNTTGDAFIFFGMGIQYKWGGKKEKK
ncbi:MAG: hypothetical protein GXO78_10420 [Calditrichaeota bacterium]|nr:hypothetical protein [Calditrichota bacterium]